jgi:hypothetical protein
MTIGSIERVPLRDVWGREAHDFTVWLEANVGVLSDAVGFELSGGQREQVAGSFSVDASTPRWSTGWSDSSALAPHVRELTCGLIGQSGEPGFLR